MLQPILEACLMAIEEENFLSRWVTIRYDVQFEAKGEQRYSSSSFCLAILNNTGPYQDLFVSDANLYASTTAPRTTTVAMIPPIRPQLTPADVVLAWPTVRSAVPPPTA
jgi:hypothetical protein